MATAKMAAAPLPLPPAGGYINAPPKALDQSATTSAQGACVAFFFLFPDISQNLISYFIFYRLPTLMFRSLRSPRIKFCFFSEFFILFYLFILFFLIISFLVVGAKLFTKGKWTNTHICFRISIFVSQTTRRRLYHRYF